MGQFEFDVFLCHNSQDKTAVIEIAQQLLNRGMALEEVVSLTGLSEQELTQNLSN
jgi:hypothetical protein